MFPSQVLVEHIRAEYLTAPSGSNKFTWVARIILDRTKGYEATAVALKIVSIECDYQPLADNFQQAMKSLYSPTCHKQMTNIFAREWLKLPIAKARQLRFQF